MLSSAQARTALLDDMLAAWIADLRGDGFTEEQIARRVRRGEPLRRAPLIIVPCLVAEAAHAYPDARRDAAEREMFVVAMGAAVQNLLVALAVEGLGSCWVSCTMFCRPSRRVLGCRTAGTDGRGRRRHPAAPAPDRPPRDPGDFMLHPVTPARTGAAAGPARSPGGGRGRRRRTPAGSVRVRNAPGIRRTSDTSAAINSAGMRESLARYSRPPCLQHHTRRAHRAGGRRCGVRAGKSSASVHPALGNDRHSLVAPRRAA